MGNPIIFYNNILTSAYNILISFENSKYPISNIKDYKAHTLTKISVDDAYIFAQWTTSQIVNCLAIIHHNIWTKKYLGTPQIIIDMGGNYESKTITADGMFLWLLSSSKSGTECIISFGYTLDAYIGELFLGQYLEYPYPLTAPFVVTTKGKYNSTISDSGHFMSSDYRYKTAECKFEIQWIDETWYNTYHQPFLDYAVQGYPFVFAPDKSNPDEFYWARLKPNSSISKSRSYSGIIDKISLDFELIKYEL